MQQYDIILCFFVMYYCISYLPSQEFFVLEKQATDYCCISVSWKLKQSDEYLM